MKKNQKIEINKKGVPGSAFCNQKTTTGFTLVEMLFVIAIFVIVILAISTSYVKILDLVKFNKLRVLALSVASEQIEIARNLPYEDVGNIGGIPAGIIQATTTVSRNNIVFFVQTTVRNVDDPFDGQIGSSTNDLAPADYKLIEIDVSFGNSHPEFKTLSIVTYIAPKGLENSSNNGALFIGVIDANGNPVSGASVKITNTSVVPSVSINEITNNEGKLNLVDVPPSGAYHIEVSKSGYSSDKTLPVTVTNPNPSKPDSLVIAQMVTTTSFSIDKVSSLNVYTLDYSCAGISDISFDVTGSKKIGESPVILKYPKTSFNTSVSGLKEINNLEWDSYSINLNSSGHDLLDSNPISPVNLNPDTDMDVKFILIPKSSQALLVNVVDSMGVGVTDALVTLVKDTFTASSTTDSPCLNTGKTAFTGIPTGTYSATVSKSGYADTVQNIIVGTGLTKQNIILMP